MSDTARALGLDVGERRIGVAVSDALGLTAQRVTVIDRVSTESACDAVRRLVEEREARVVVVGLPLSMNGSKGPQAKRVETFAKALRRHVTVPIEFIDERLTTVQSERALRETGTKRKRRKAIVDQVAAQLILQQYLDMHRHGS